MSAVTQNDGTGLRQEAPPSSVIDALSDLFSSVRIALSDILGLLSLEARRAGLTLMWMVVLGVIAAICIVAAWLGLMAALVFWLASMGLPGIHSVLVIALLNGVTGVVLIYCCVSMSRNLLFSATRRQIAPESVALRVKP